MQSASEHPRGLSDGDFDALFTRAIAFTPRLPSGITSIAITLRFRSRRLRIDIIPDTTTYRLRSGDPLRLLHDGSPIVVTTANAITRPNPAAPPQEPATGGPSTCEAAHTAPRPSPGPTAARPLEARNHSR